MNNKNTSQKKLPSIRTFASDREHKDGVSPTETKPDSHTKASVVETKEKDKPSTHETKQKEIEAEVKKITIPEPKRTPIPEPKPELKKKVIKENIVSSEMKKPIPPPPTTKPEASIKIKASNDDAGSATIITDTKKDRFKLFPAIGESIKKWIENYKLEQKKKKIPKYTVPETARRKGVIQKATSQTGRLTSADHETIQDRIRKREEKDEKTTNKGVDTKPENDNESHTIWTPNTEPGVLLLEENTHEIKNITVTPRKSFYTKESEIIVNDLDSIKNTKNKPDLKTKDQDKSPTEEEKITSAKEVIVPQAKITSTPTEPVKELEVEPVPQTPTSETKEEVIPTPQVKILEVEKEPSPTPKKSSSIFNTGKKLSITSTNTNSLAFVMSLLVLIIVGLTLTFNLNQSKENDVTTLNHKEIINADFEPIFLQVREIDDLINRILSEYEKTNPHYFAFVSTPEKQNFIKPSAIMLNLGFRVSPNFNQSISHIYFGSVSQNQPFIILNVTDYTVAISGMLEWENNMKPDLTTILKIDTEENEEVPSELNFRDGMLSGKDVRILKNNTGEEVVIYSIVDNHTVIITKDSDTLGKLIELKK